MSARIILIVEDEPALRETIAYHLRGEGYQVLAAADGKAAFDIARLNPLSLVLVDLTLPRLEGLDICRQLRTRAETARV